MGEQKKVGRRYLDPSSHLLAKSHRITPLTAATLLRGDPAAALVPLHESPLAFARVWALDWWVCAAWCVRTHTTGARTDRAVCLGADAWKRHRFDQVRMVVVLGAGPWASAFPSVLL